MAEGQARRIADKYVLREELGAGAMGVVWRAHDESLGRDVAIKEIRLPAGMPHAEARSWTERTLREARAAARLSGTPGIVVVHEVVYEDGRPWIVMELLRGRTLEQVVKQDGPLPPQQAAAIGAKLLTGLRAAHAAGIVHRDVKPSNVMFDGERTVITDFGIAALDGGTVLTQSGTVLGTPSFMAPEQVRGEPATAATDLWALGATLYYAVEGRPPFQAAAVAAVLVAVLTGEPLAPMRAGPLAAVIAGLLVKDPARRTPAPVLADQLGQVADGGTIPLPPAGPGETTQRIRRRPRVARTLATLLGTGVVAVALVAIALVWLPDQLRPGADPINSPSSTTENQPVVAAPTVTVTTTVMRTVTPTPSRGAVHTITYKVGGTVKRANIGYDTPAGSEDQNGAGVPWQKSFKTDAESIGVLDVRAMNPADEGTITCEIYVDGVKVKSSVSSGRWAIASCRGEL